MLWCYCQPPSMYLNPFIMITIILPLHHIISLQIHEYALVLLALWGYGTKVADMIDNGIVIITSDEALEVMALCKGNITPTISLQP